MKKRICLQTFRLNTMLKCKENFSGQSNGWDCCFFLVLTETDGFNRYFFQNLTILRFLRKCSLLWPEPTKSRCLCFYLIEDEVFVQICLDQRWIESTTALFSAFSRCLQFINIFGYHFDFFLPLLQLLWWFSSHHFFLRFWKCMLYDVYFHLFYKY